MIVHYLKVAVRNLLKYKAQTIISIMGLAVGFVCFALSSYWIEYESSYDHYRKDVEQLYMVRTNDGYSEGRISSDITYVFGSYLKESFPEIEVSAPFHIGKEHIEINGVYEDVMFSSADSAWMSLMDIRIVEGNRNFMDPKNNLEIGITLEKAKEWFGMENPIGKEIKFDRSTKTICAVVTANNSHTNFPFSLIGHPELGKNWWYWSWNILIKVKQGADIEKLEAKINDNLPKEINEVNAYRKTGVNRIYLTPVTTLRSAKDYLEEKEAIITLDYIIYFSVAGGLIILCAIINYLALFVNRMRVRQREIGLRMLHGASLRSLMGMLSVEFLILLICAIFMSCVLVEISIGSFARLASIDAPNSFIYGKSILSVCVISIIILLACITLLYFMHCRGMRLSIRQTETRQTGVLIRKGSLMLQLFVCLSFIIGTVLMNQQINYLRTQDLGMSYENRACFIQQGSSVDMGKWKEKIKRLPMVTEVLHNYYHPLISQEVSIEQFDKWEGNEQTLEYPIPANRYFATEEFFYFYDLSLLSGRWLNNLSTKEEIIINESLAKKFGWLAEEAIGKHIYKSYITYTVVGVVNDCHYGPPTSKMLNTCFVADDINGMIFWNTGVCFKYKEGTWEQCKQALESMCEEEKATGEIFYIYNEEETYNSFLRSEDMLTRLLSFASIICVFIAIFGIYSLVTLTCEKRRKEIAIRKVNGANVKDILYMFFREYITMLVVSALVAFPVTYVIVKQWIQGYVRQMQISILPFIGVFVGLMLVVIVSIYWRVWKAANENPAEVIKSE